jgi:hypothetical protein
VPEAVLLLILALVVAEQGAARRAELQKEQASEVARERSARRGVGRPQRVEEAPASAAAGRWAVDRKIAKELSEWGAAAQARAARALPE